MGVPSSNAFQFCAFLAPRESVPQRRTQGPCKHPRRSSLHLSACCRLETPGRDKYLESAPWPRTKIETVACLSLSLGRCRVKLNRGSMFQAPPERLESSCVPPDHCNAPTCSASTLSVNSYRRARERRCSAPTPSKWRAYSRKQVVSSSFGRYFAGGFPIDAAAGQASGSWHQVRQ